MGAALNLIPSYGRAPSTERVYDTKPVAKGKRISLIGALTSSGISAAFTLEGTLNGITFLYFIKHILCPLLKEGNRVVIDNAPAHKIEGVKTMIEQYGATLVYLPPYSPEFNAIELAWNKIKTYLRKRRARTVEQLHRAYFKALKLITPDNAQKFVAHAMGFIN
jgi:transposase